MENHLIIRAYLIYLPIALTLTYFVSHTLFKNGKIFMLDIFRGREVIALSTNRLFEVGFYLMNMGFALLILRIREYQNRPFDTNQELIEALSYKIGGFSIYLGIMLFLNLYMFFRGKKKTSENIQREMLIQQKTIQTPTK